MKSLPFIALLCFYISCGKGDVEERCWEEHGNGEKKACDLYRVGLLTDGYIGTRLYYENGQMERQCIRTGLNVDRTFKCLYFDEAGNMKEEARGRRCRFGQRRCRHHVYWK